MAFRSKDEASSRLLQKGPLSQNEILDCYEWWSLLSTAERERVEMHTRLLNAAAIRDFDEASRRLGARLYWLTWGVFILTGVLVVLAIVRH